jgi:hypothetical protein
MEKSDILAAFNNHFNDYLDDIERIFPEDMDIKTAINYLKSIRKMNPRLVIRIWKSYICDPYREPIINGDINFFMNKSFNEDIQYLDTQKSQKEILDKIEYIKTITMQMGEDNLKKNLEYIQNLLKICDLYHSS